MQSLSSIVHYSGESFNNEIRISMKCIQGVADASRRLLYGIGAFIDGVCRINPSW